MVGSGQMDELLYTSIEISLTDIITSDYSGASLFFSGLIRLFIPLSIIFVLFLCKWTKFLAFIYYGYQAMLLGASTASLVAGSGISGIINLLFVVLPINIVNFFILSSAVIIFYKRYKLAKTQRITLVHSLKIMLPKILMIVVGCLFSAFIYGFIYPLLLKSIIIINP